MKRHFFTPFMMAVLGLFTFQEVQAQTALCHPTVAIETGVGCNATLTFDDIDDGSFDFDTYTISQTEFSGPDTLEVELTVMQNGGQSSTCTSTLYIQDKIPPVVLVKNNVWVKMDTTNMATITPAMIDNGSFDFCTNMVSMTVSPSTVTCQNISPLPVTFTVTDDSGNFTETTVNVRLSNAANNTEVLACNDLIEVTLNEGGSKKMYPYEILEGGPYKCWEQYSLDILENNLARSDDFVRYSDVTKTLLVKVTDNATQVACWGLLKVKTAICDVLIVCDTLSRCAPVGDCTSGHSMDDDVEWPCDIVLQNPPYNLYTNPTPQAMANYLQQDIDDFIPVLYGDNSLCMSSIGTSYEDIALVQNNEKLIYRTWTILHWPTGVTYTYEQELRINGSILDACDICDTLPWDSPISGCNGGHTDLDAVEWPADLIVDGLRIAPTDFFYDNGVENNNAMPWVREECRSIISVDFSDEVTPLSPDGLNVTRTWTLFNKKNGITYNYVQDIEATNIPSSDTKVCVRRRNGEPMNDIEILPGQVMQQGPCTEFTLLANQTLIQPVKEDTDYIGGIDLADFIMMREQILGRRELDAIQKAAADWHGGIGVTTLDAVLIMRMIMGESVDLSAWPSPWKFAYVTSNLTPFQVVPQQVTVSPGSPQNYGYHFVGYKLGDINDSYTEMPIFPTPLTMYDKILTKGETYTISLYTTADLKSKGIQCKIPILNGAIVKNIKSDHFELNEFTQNNEFSSLVSYNHDDLSTVEIKKGKALLRIEIEATQNDVLHNVLRFLEGDHQKIITEDYRSIPFDIHFDGLITVDTKNQNLVNVQVQPNPVHDMLSIQHDLDGPISVTVFSSTGQKVLAQETFNSSLSVSGLLPAMYLLQVRNQSGKIGYTTFIKN